LAGCPALVVHGTGPRDRPGSLVIVGRSTPFSPSDVERIGQIVVAQDHHQARVRRVRPAVGPSGAHDIRATAQVSSTAVVATESDPDASPRPWSRLVLGALPAAAGGSGALRTDRGEQVVSELAIGAWALLDDIYPLIEDGGAMIAARGTGGWFAPIAATRLRALDGARSIPAGHPALQRLKAEGGTLTAVARSGEPAITAGLPLSHWPALMLAVLGDADAPVGLLLIGRTRQPADGELASAVQQLRVGHVPRRPEPPAR
jgi:hypothetical protein